MRTLLSLLAIPLLALSLSGCNSSESDNLAKLAAETICMASEAMEEMMAMMADPAALSDPSKLEEMEQKGAEMEAKMDELIAKYGYENEAELEIAYAEKVTDKEAWKATVMEMAQDNCDADEEMISEWLTEMEA